MFIITITGPVVVTDDSTEKRITDTKRLASLDGLHSGRETCSKYHHGTLAELELKGGQVKLVFDSMEKKLRVVSEFTSARKLTRDELGELIDDTQGQWSDGIGEGCFDSVMDKREIFIDLSPDSGGKVKATQTDDGKPAPKKSPAKVAAGELWKAAANGDLKAVKKLVESKVELDTRGQYGWTPLIAAIANDKTDVAIYLIEQGASPTVTDKEKDGPLMWAAIRSDWVSHRNVKLAEALLDAGAPVDSRDKAGRTPLMRGKGVKLAELLIARGADVNAKTTEKYNSGRTPLMMAASIEEVRVLLEAGADPKAVEENGMHTWEFHTGAAAKLLKERAGVK
jgi:hypothetical protein